MSSTLERRPLGWLLAALLLVAGAVGAGAEEQMRVHARELEHRPTADAIALVRPLLSPGGSVTEKGSSLVVRDRPETVARIVALLDAFDGPPGEVELEIHVVRAGPARAVISPPEPPRPLPEELIGKFRGLLRYEDYEVVASASVSSKEGEDVSWDLGSDLDVSFRLGGLISGRRLRLEGFRVREQPPMNPNKGRALPAEDLFRGTLNLWVDRPFTLVIADGAEAEEALLIAITCKPAEAP